MLAISCGPAVTLWDYRLDPSQSKTKSNPEPIVADQNERTFSFRPGEISDQTSNERNDSNGNIDHEVIADLAWNRNGTIVATCSRSDPSGSNNPNHRPNVILTHLDGMSPQFHPKPTLSQAFSTGEGESAAGSATSLSFGGKSRFLCLSDDSAYISVYDTKKKSRVRCFRLPEAVGSASGNSCSRAFIDPSDSIVAATSSQDGGLYLFRLKGGSKAAPLRLIPDVTASAVGSRALCFSPQIARHATVGMDDGSIHIWDIGRTRPAASLHSNNDVPLCSIRTATTSGRADSTLAITDLCYSPDNARLLTSCSLSGHLFFHDAVSAKCVESISIPVGSHNGSHANDSTTSNIPNAHFKVGLTSLSFNIDGVSCAVGTTDGRVLLYDLRRTSAPKANLIVGQHSINGSLTSVNSSTIGKAVTCVRFRTELTSASKSPRSKTPKTIRPSSKPKTRPDLDPRQPNKEPTTEKNKQKQESNTESRVEGLTERTTERVGSNDPSSRASSPDISQASFLKTTSASVQSTGYASGNSVTDIINNVSMKSNDKFTRHSEQVDPPLEKDDNDSRETVHTQLHPSNASHQKQNNTLRSAGLSVESDRSQHHDESFRSHTKGNENKQNKYDPDFPSEHNLSRAHPFKHNQPQFRDESNQLRHEDSLLASNIVNGRIRPNSVKNKSESPSCIEDNSLQATGSSISINKSQHQGQPHRTKVDDTYHSRYEQTISPKHESSRMHQQHSQKARFRHDSNPTHHDDSLSASNIVNERRRAHSMTNKLESISSGEDESDDSGENQYRTTRQQTYSNNLRRSYLDRSKSSYPTSHTAAANNTHNNKENTNSVLSSLRNEIKSLRYEFNETLQNLHVDMLRQFQRQSDELTSMFRRHEEIVLRLMEENHELRRENERLRRF